MAFWGIEVKPGRPVTHSCEKAGGRLRISQATLGIGEATKKSIVQCNVGNRSPVLLCVLLPDKTESCHLDLEFEEADDVVFSVIGPRSVYLTGYYVRRSQLSNPHSDTESYGVDIENTQTEGSSYRSDDDKYEDSFINDDDELRVSTQSPVLSGEGTEDVAFENDKPKDGKGFRNRLKKKYRVIESDDDDANSSHEIEDEDDWSLSAFKSKRAAEATMSDAEETIARVLAEMGAEAKGGGACDSESKQKVDPLDISGKQERATKLPFDEKGTEIKNEKNELPKEVKTLEETKASNEEVLPGDDHGNKAEGTIINQSLPMSNAEDQLQFLDVAKPKKKRKARSMKEEKTCKVQTENKDQSVIREDKEHEVEASTNLKIGANDLVNPPGSDSVDGRKSKKRRNELQLEGMHTEGIDEKCQSSPKNGNIKQDLLPSNSVTKDLPAAGGEYQEQQRLEENCTEEIDANCQNTPKEDKLPHADSTSNDLPATNEEYHKQNDNDINIKSEPLTNNTEPEKKRKKKMKKTQGDIGSDMGVPRMTENEETVPMEYEGQTTHPAPIHRTTLSSGLIIEELKSGPPDGKVAALGKKVKIYYTATLKEGGNVFDSNAGKDAFKFRLGDETLIDAWNVGIDGMRVGDKRRLIVPPSLGYGDRGVGEMVPPNSWVVFDIELVGVRK
ncbi:FKBP-type peptidyl-prolyl cis-trans isomerase [Handroanthus impetiginosus]|uniref:peptidylprolyl isomerase n=1 Tax=Handroanthus impetiginosus TaxID=429701 RepID=A0A2G9I226_9LAMI|nr:FKBP-type peptidyl-prolyl cis-trans isomerase [Handroanthus impetiginosus]